MLPQLGGPGTAPKAALTASVAGVVIILVAAIPEDEDRLWRATLCAIGAALVVAAVASAIRERRRRRLRAERAPEYAMPRWAPALPEAWFGDLERRFAEYEDRIRRADHAALESRRRESQSTHGVWHVLAAAVNSEERAKGRFVADLHDTVVQTIVIATYQAEDDDIPRDVLAESLREAERQLRDMMVTTRPPDLRRDLGTAARNLSHIMHRRHGLVVDWAWPDHDAELPASVANTLYRFWQEALANVAKHAGVRHASAGLKLGAEVVAWVEDDGEGFNLAGARAPHPADTAAGQHVGLALMRDRAQQIGATTEVLSSPGQGTRVTMSMPYPPIHLEHTVDVGAAPAVPEREA